MEPGPRIDPTHLPGFITPPGETDTLFVVVAIFLALAVLAAGGLFLTVHSLPERIAHRSKKLQLEIVAVLCLLALFTHEHLFWVVALVLALIDLPDITTPVQRMAAALERLAGLPPIADTEMTRAAEEDAADGVSESETAALPPAPDETATKEPPPRQKAAAEAGKPAAAKPASTPKSKES